MSGAATLCLAPQALAGGITGDPHRRLVIGGDCMGCDFADANLAGAHIYGGDFSRANFSDAHLIGARFVEISLEGADLSDARLNEARFAGASFVSANLSGADMADVRAQRVDFSGADMREADLSGAVFMLTDLSGANLMEADLGQAAIRSSDLSGAELSEARLVQARITSTNMSGVAAREADLRQAIIEHVDLSGANLRDANLTQARLVRVNLSGADLSGAQGLSRGQLRDSCGSQATRLPDGLELSACPEGGLPGLAVPRGHTFVFAGNGAGEAREMEAARIAFRAALEGLERSGTMGETWNHEALTAAREGMRAAAAAMAEVHLEAQIDFEEIEREMADARAEIEAEFGPSWHFDIRRAEVGEPLRVILERAARDVPEAPRPPRPSAPGKSPAVDEPALDGATPGRDGH